MKLIVKEVEDFQRFLHRTEYFIRNGNENLHPDTLRFYLDSLGKMLQWIKTGKLVDAEEIRLMQSRLSSCEQYLNTVETTNPTPSKISRTADLESRQLLLRGSAQRESRQRDQLLKVQPKKQKNQEQHLTVRQRRLLLLENDDDNRSGSKNEINNEMEAQNLAGETLELTRMLKEQAMNTKSIVGEDNKLLNEMDSSVEKNLGNLKQATHGVEDILNSSGSSQYAILFCVFIIWIFMIVIITTVPKLN